MVKLRWLGLLGVLFSTAGLGDDLPPWLTERRIIGHNDLEPIEKAAGTLAYDAARAVARVEAIDDGIGFCTATRVGPDLFLTNYHCLDYKPCSNLQFHLAYERGVDDAHQLEVKCRDVLAKSITFDYALFRVEVTGTAPDPSKRAADNWTLQDLQPPPPAPAPPQPLPSLVTLDQFPIAMLWNGPIQLTEDLFVAGFPGGRRKEIDRGPDCKLRTIVPEMLEERQTITHYCDTEGGSSGSPLMDRKTGYIIGLHWGGNAQFNMAIPISEVLGDLKAVLPAELYRELKIVQ